MLQTTNLCKAFGTVNVIDSVNLSIKQDEVVSLLGPNGAGKTTMVNLISGHLLPSSGNITFNDEDITYAPAYKRINLGIARNFQMTSLFQDNTVLDNVRICLFSIYGYINSTLVPADFYKDITNEAMQILIQFGISEKRNLLAINLPEGDKKVLDTALAFALKSKLLYTSFPSLVNLKEPLDSLTNPKFSKFSRVLFAFSEYGPIKWSVNSNMSL